mmetsp:Transcript_26416/g.83729  ORF Transcript_26416/g.83729 Transcript_26416/m.83729 type:complete len:443 (+) Transcript_26416:64-1392(+)
MKPKPRYSAKSQAWSSFMRVTSTSLRARIHRLVQSSASQKVEPRQALGGRGERRGRWRWLRRWRARRLRRREGWRAGGGRGGGRLRRRPRRCGRRRRRRRERGRHWRQRRRWLEGRRHRRLEGNRVNKNGWLAAIVKWPDVALVEAVVQIEDVRAAGLEARDVNEGIRVVEAWLQVLLEVDLLVGVEVVDDEQQPVFHVARAGGGEKARDGGPHHARRVGVDAVRLFTRAGEEGNLGREALARAAVAFLVREDGDAATVEGREDADRVVHACIALVLGEAGQHVRWIDDAGEERRRVHGLAVLGERAALDEDAAVAGGGVGDGQRVVPDALLLRVVHADLEKVKVGVGLHRNVNRPSGGGCWADDEPVRAAGVPLPVCIDLPAQDVVGVGRFGVFVVVAQPIAVSVVEEDHRVRGGHLKAEDASNRATGGRVGLKNSKREGS